MAQLSARQIAQAALRLWRKEKRFADSIISELLAKAGLTPSDRAFALELFYGVLRNLTLLDFWIACLRVARVDADLRDILRLGFYQLFFLFQLRDKFNNTSKHWISPFRFGLVEARRLLCFGSGVFDEPVSWLRE